MRPRSSPAWLLRLRGSVARRGWLASLRLAATQLADRLEARATGRSRYERWLAGRPPLSPAVPGPPEEHPLLSVLLPTHDPDPTWLERALDSVRAQRYEKWQLCIADDASGSMDVRDWVRSRSDGDRRVRCVRLERNAGISAATNAALELAAGSHFALLDHDDELHRDALLEMAGAIRRDDPDLLYSDEDKIGVDGHLRDPAFKPDFSPDWLLSCNFVSHLGVYRSSLARELGGFRSAFDGSQDYDLALRFAERTRRIHHVPRVLYHWRTLSGSTADPWSAAKPWAYDAARRALRAHLDRTGVRAEVSDGAGRGFYRVRRFAPEGWRASLIVWGRRPASGLDGTDAEPLFVASASPSAAELNAAARRARGEVLVFLDGGLRPTRAGWLEELASQALRSEVGCVGTRIAGPRRRVLHAGVVLGGACGVRCERPALFGDEPGPLGASAAIRNASAVAGGCLATSAEAFRGLGGFDTAFDRSLFDVDLGLRASEAGLRVVYDPYAEMRSRRGRLHAPEPGDVARLCERWSTRIAAGDPYYNPAFGPIGPLYEARLQPGPPAGRSRKH